MESGEEERDPNKDPPPNPDSNPRNSTMERLPSRTSSSTSRMSTTTFQRKSTVRQQQQPETSLESNKSSRQQRQPETSTTSSTPLPQEEEEDVFDENAILPFGQRAFTPSSSDAPSSNNTPSSQRQSIVQDITTSTGTGFGGRRASFLSSVSTVGASFVGPPSRLSIVAKNSFNPRSSISGPGSGRPSRTSISRPPPNFGGDVIKEDATPSSPPPTGLESPLVAGTSTIPKNNVDPLPLSLQEDDDQVQEEEEEEIMPKRRVSLRQKLDLMARKDGRNSVINLIRSSVSSRPSPPPLAPLSIDTAVSQQSSRLNPLPSSRLNPLIQSATTTRTVRKSKTPQEKREMVQAAKNRWKILKIQVAQGYFKTIKKDAVDLNDLNTAVDILWKDMQAYSYQAPPEQEFDTSSNFLKETNLLFHKSEKVRGRRKVVVNYLEITTQPKKTKEKTSGTTPSPHQKTGFMREWGLKGLSFDAIANTDVNNRLFAISRGINLKSNDDALGEQSAIQNQIVYNRGWKLLLVGLTQSDCFARYDTLLDLSRALSCLIDTLNDPLVFEDIVLVLIEMTMVDERRENRVKAVYLLGQIGSTIGSIDRWSPLFQQIFHHLAKLILAHQIRRQTRSLLKSGDDDGGLGDDMQLHLFRAIGKFVAFKQTERVFESNECILMYLVYKELDAIFHQLEKENQGGRKITTSKSVFVIMSIFEVLNTDFLKTEKNQVYVAALLQTFLDRVMAIEHIELKKLAIRFISVWLPIKKEEALLIGIDRLIEGIQLCKRNYSDVLTELFYYAELNELQDKLHAEEIKVSLRAKLIRQLIQTPGTVANLLPVPGVPGFFCNINTGLHKTKAVMVELPIHGKSNVTITRYVPSIPGTPCGTTTTPPLFIVGDRWTDARNPPTSEYEYMERIGNDPNIPSGYTSNPYGPLLGSRSESQEGESVTLIPKKKTLWSDKDEIPAGTSKYPIRNELTDGQSTDSDKETPTCPPGFLTVCPFTGFDPEKIEMSGNLVSALYGKSLVSSRPVSRDNNAGNRVALMNDKGLYQDYNAVGAHLDERDMYTAPEGYTVNRHTPLYPCRIPALKQTEPEHDFVVGAPVIIDIIQPHKPQLQRILCSVYSLEEDTTPIVVQKTVNDIGSLYRGAVFNMYVKSREDFSNWMVVQLEILDDDYDDGIDFSNPNQITPLESSRRRCKVDKVKKTFSVAPAVVDTFSYPIPVGYTQTGEPYFCPPVNMPLFPTGYNKNHYPYYGKTPSVKPPPLGLTNVGTRYYSAVDKKGSPEVTAPKNQLAGYDSEGHPIFIPRGFTLPAPSGFTVDGIPFYDIPSLIRQHGDFALPGLFVDLGDEPNEQTEWEEMFLYYQKKVAINRRLETAFQKQLVGHLAGSHTLLRRRMLLAKNRVMNPFENKMQHNGASHKYEVSVLDPDNISTFLRNGTAYQHLKPHPIRLMIEPSHIEFASARSHISKSVALRHKAGRGDRTERDFFLAVEPPGVFSVREFLVTLQGEGFHEIAISYYPLAYKKPLVHGGLHVFDRYGKRMFTAQLTGIKKKFFQVTPAVLDLGWVNMLKTKESHITVENMSDYQFDVSFQLGAKSDPSEKGKKKNPFNIAVDYVTIRPQESVKVPITFTPAVSGTLTEHLKLFGPGGDELVVVLQGTTDLSFSIFPERMNADMTTLSRERTNFIRKVKTLDNYDFLNEEERNMIDNISRSQVDAEFRENLHTIDFGICLPPEKSISRLFTISNWSNHTMTYCVYSFDKCIAVPHLVRVSAQSAVTVEIAFNYFASKCRGNYSSVITLACQDLDTVQLKIKAYIGQPVYIPAYENIFFAPCRLGQSSYMSLPIINDSFYPLVLFLKGFDEPNADSPIGFQLLERYTNASTPLAMEPFSTRRLTLMFQPTHGGVSTHQISIVLVRPNQLTLPAAMRERDIQLFGISFQPRIPLSDYSLHPSIMKLFHWLSLPRAFLTSLEEVKDEDLQGTIQTPADYVYDVNFKNDVFMPEIAGDFNAIPNIMTTQNRGDSKAKVQYFASPFISIDPKVKDLVPGELTKLEVYAQPPPGVSNLVTMYGFATVINQATSHANSIPIIKRLGLGFMVLPFANHSEQQVVFDFGRIDIAGDCNLESVRHLMLTNPYTIAYRFSIKVSPSSKKSNVFQVPTILGKLSSNETVSIPIKFKSEVSGAFETKCEVFADPPDQLAKGVRIATVILRGIAVLTGLSGVPDSIDFGSAIVNYSSSRKINLQNDGTQELEISTLVRPPFTFTPAKFTIPAKSNQIVDVSFSPLEHRDFKGILHLFSNQKQFHIPLSGLGGNSELICHEYAEAPVDFGLLEDGMIAFKDFYLTNKGTIPLKLTRIFSPTPRKLRLAYLGITNVVKSSQDSSNKAKVRKDYWRRVKVFVRSLRFIPNERLTSYRKLSAPPLEKSSLNLEEWKLIEIDHIDDYDSNNRHALNIPPLSSLLSYRFRIGYPVTYFEERDREVSFEYLPISENVDDENEEMMRSSTTIEITGDAYVPLQIMPYALNFGNCAAESFIVPETVKSSKALDYGVVKRIAGSNSGSGLILRLVNKSYTSQKVQLENISPGFFIRKNNWSVPGGSEVEVVVEFHPPREQTRYLGSAIFSHPYGTISVPLDGIGASADIICDDIIDFGTLRLDSGGKHSFRFHNRGILASSYEIDLVQSTPEFSFKSGDPYEAQGVISHGESVILELECKCKSKHGAEGSLILRWKKVPKSKTETIIIPIKLEIGYPEFKVNTTALDFAATYIGINKKMSLVITNEGNASCSWVAELDDPCVTLDVMSGLLEPGTTKIIKCIYSPVDFGVLDSYISFKTDAGHFKVVCFGVVGVPYLKIMRSDPKLIDFGILTVGKHHSIFADIGNTGKASIEFEVVWLTMSRDNVPCKVGEFENFLAEPTRATVQPGEVYPLKLSVFPKDYAVTYEGVLKIRGFTGEEHLITVKAVGGQAIIKIKPPKPIAGSKVSTVQSTPVPLAQQKRSVVTPPAGQTARNLIKTHIDILYEVLGGLKAAEEKIDETMTPEMLAMKEIKNDGITVLDKAGVEIKDLSYKELDYLLREEMQNVALAEREMDQIMTQLDPTGKFSRVTPPSRGKGTKASTPDSEAFPSRPPSRDYAGYQPGRKSIKIPSEDAFSPRVLTPLSKGADGRPKTPSSGLDGVSPGGKTLPPLAPLLETHSKNNTYASPSDAAKKMTDGKGAGPFRGSDAKPFDVGKPALPVLKDSLQKTSVGSSLVEIKQSSSSPPTSSAKPPSRGLIKSPLTGGEGLSDDSKLMASAENKESTSRVEKVIAIAEKLGLVVDTASIDSMEKLQTTIMKFLQTTENAMRTVKERLLNESWVPNRGLLHKAVRKLQISRTVIETLMNPLKQTEDPEENVVYTLDLICGGERSEMTLLFNVPNEGNLSFEYEIIPKSDDSTIPEGAKKDMQYFLLENEKGTLAPGDNVNISACLYGLISGSYRQGYILKSGDEEIMSFSIGGAVGNPILEFSPDKIDFGLVGKGYLLEKPLLVKNIGSYEGYWELTMETGHDVFKIASSTGLTGPSESSKVNVAFAPLIDGPVGGSIKMEWKHGPTYILMTGSGGSPKLDIQFLTAEDKAYKGLDFGRCIVGCRYERKIIIQNVGSMEGHIQFSHPNPQIFISLARDNNGDILLEPGHSVEATIIYVPEKVEKVSNNLLLAVLNSKNANQSVLVKGRSGTESIESEGALDFLNIHLNEWQQKLVKFKNTGTFDLPFKVRFEPPSVETSFLVDYEDWVPGSNFSAEKEMVISIKPIPTIVQEVKGEIICSTILAGAPKDFAFPFSFKIFAEEIQALVSNDISVGRVIPGEQAKTDQIIVNNGNNKINFRAKIVGVEGSENEELDWFLTDESMAGVVNPNEQVVVTAFFKAVKGRGDKWQNAKLVIERLDPSESGKWVVFSEVGLKAGLGEAKFALEPESGSLNFETIPIGEIKTLKFLLKNPGTASCPYEISPGWMHDNLFIIEDRSSLQGTIASDGGVVEIPVRFKPTAEGFFSTELTITTPVATKTINIAGNAQLMKLSTSSLPKQIDFKAINLGSYRNEEFTLESGCNIDINVDAFFDEGDEYNGNKFLTISPTSCKLKTGVDDIEKPSCIFEISCGVDLDFDDDDIPKPESVAKYPVGIPLKSLLNLKNQYGETLGAIPISFTLETFPVAFFSSSIDPNSYSSSANLSTIAFGKISLETGDTKSFAVYNPNGFKVHGSFEFESSTGSQFKVSQPKFTCNPNAVEIVEITLLPLDSNAYPNGFPKNVIHEGVLTITPQINTMPSLKIPCNGTLIDVNAGLIAPSNIQFDNVLTARNTVQIVKVKNSSSRPLPWKFLVEDNYKDVFIIDTATQDGILPPKSSVDLMVTFKPQIGVTYSAVAYLSSGDEVSNIELFGTGVEPKIEAQFSNLDYGIVGVEAPEYREIPFTNPTSMPLKIKISSDNPEFTPEKTEMIIPPYQSVTLKVLFAPKEGSVTRLEVGNISLHLESDDGSEVAALLSTIRLEGRGGNFNFDVEGSDVEQLEESDPIVASVFKPELYADSTSILIKFPNGQRNQKQRKTFDVENSGDTPLDFITELVTGQVLKDQETQSMNGMFNFYVTPNECKILPHSKSRITVIVEGVKDGSDIADFVIKTKNLAHNRAIHVHIAANIVTQSEIENIKSYLRADENVETRYDLIKQEEKLVMTDLNLWKILAPIVRISSLLPSQELSFVKPVEPSVSGPSIEPYVVRPPAIPESLPVKGKKWMNRTNYGVDQKKASSRDELDDKQTKKEKAIEFLANSALERLVSLEKFARKN